MAVKPELSVKANKSKKSAAPGKSYPTHNPRQSEFAHLAEDIISNMNVGLYVVQNGKFIYVSPLFQQFSGYLDADLSGTNPLDYVHPDDKDFVREKAIALLKSKSSEAYEYRFIRKNGEILWVLERITSITHNGERAVVASFMDITERKQMEETVRQSEQRYRTILEAMEDAYFEVDLAGHFIFLNDAICRILKYRREDLLGKGFKVIVVQDDIPVLFNAFSRIYTTGQVERAIGYTFVCSDGQTGSAEIAGFPLQNQKGETIGFRGIGRDITERRKMEESLLESEEKHRDIIENSRDGYFEVDLDGNYTFFNQSLCEIHGYSKDELMGMNHRQYADEENSKKIFKAFNKIYETGISGSIFDYEILRKDGVKRQIEVSASLKKDSSGKPIGFRGTSRDVTERRQMEQAVRESEARYRTILDEMEDAYFEVDIAGNFTFLNDAICRLIRYPREELLGKSFRVHVIEDDIPILYNAFGKIYNSGNPERNICYRAIRKDGTKRYAEIAGFPLRNSKGELIGFRGIGRDITERRQMEEDLRQSEEKYRTILENVEEGYFEVDLGGNFTFFNDSLCRMIGYPKEELMGMNNRQYTDEENSKKVFQTYHKIYKTGKPDKGFDWQITRKDGVKRYVEEAVLLQKDSSGKPIGFRGIVRDITDRISMEESLRQSEEKYRSILENIEEGYFEIDLTGNFTFFNDSMCRFLGYSREELTGVSHENLTDEENAKKLFQAFDTVYKTGSPVKGYDWEILRKDGEKRILEASISLKKGPNGQPDGFRGITHDVTERKLTEEKIHYLATHDALTGLPNRMMFSQIINQAIHTAQRYKRQFAVLFLDLDRFKNVNDAMGHKAGDQLLEVIARRLNDTLRAVDVAARFGGDEFVIFIEGVSDLSDVATVARKILDSIIQPVTIMEQERRITASIGIAVYPKDAEDEQTLMKNADIAMYLAKEEGKNNYQFYSDKIPSKSLGRLSIETNLRDALERKELSLLYQAKVDFKTNMITGVEALLRWQNPFLGAVTPTQFIPVAEETGLIVPIGRWVIRTACEQNVAWQKQGLPDVCISVNLSPRQLVEDNLIEDIKKALDDTGMAPNLLELEISEGIVMHSPAQTILILTKLKNLGVRLAIDDFGTGYSSLAQIKRFPIDTLKVDRSFVHNIAKDDDGKAVIKAMIDLGKTLSLTIVAEGVETEHQMNFLKDNSCDEMQGYYFSKPTVPQNFADLLRKHVPPAVK